MTQKKEKLGDKAAVKGTMVQAHLAWASGQKQVAAGAIAARLGPPCRALVERSVLATDWIPFRCIVAIDRAIAEAVGGTPDQVFRDLGHHSAAQNLSGVYKSFVADEPHKFFEQMALLHSRFQNFGHSTYQKTGDRTGRIRIEGYDEYSPVFCTSGLGYYEGALLMMKVPGPVRGVETACQCAGDPACVYELAW